ncbi:hypothetical protein AVEN_146160-1 [Araneus ventricosus]|uniref:Uncharacterized protein n=1 Tax=Araneus ventricosus TaxID=182803 RepID=A0A4Y2EI57_ARAVE|nr:hypothetical protein AVEN_146160-1 [Araneus ventricosus]
MEFAPQVCPSALDHGNDVKAAASEDLSSFHSVTSMKSGRFCILVLPRKTVEYKVISASEQPRTQHNPRPQHRTPVLRRSKSAATGDPYTSVKMAGVQQTAVERTRLLDRRVSGSKPYSTEGLSRKRARPTLNLTSWFKSPPVGLNRKFGEVSANSGVVI